MEKTEEPVSLPIVQVDRYFAKNQRFHTVELPGDPDPHVFKHLDELIAFLHNRDVQEFIICTQFHSLVCSSVAAHAHNRPPLQLEKEPPSTPKAP